MRYSIRGADAAWYGAAAFALSVCMGGLFACASGNAIKGYPYDAELTKRYIEHEDDFALLGRMLDTDGSVVPASQPVDSDAIAELSAERAARYQRVLRSLGASGLRYVGGPQNNSAMLISAGEQAGLARAYFVHVKPGGVTWAQRESEGDHWRGPGILETTRDSALGGGWFIRRRVGVNVLFLPY